MSLLRYLVPNMTIPHGPHLELLDTQEILIQEHSCYDPWEPLH